jgi:hypothetical protein
LSKGAGIIPEGRRKALANSGLLYWLSG